LTLKKDKISDSFLTSLKMSNLSTFIKDKSQTSWRPVSTHPRGTNQRLGLYWSSEADRSQDCLWRDL